ncbi:MAG: hypothetical protein K940chlam6_00273 [Chlamydiae bacterium]|nr:hypothetical protein [Chlamydiota bacterium]
MNRNRRPMPNKKRKALEKEIKKGQKKLSEIEDLPRTDTLTPRDALKKYPAKRQKMEKPLMDSVTKKMGIKKKKKETKHSKRTTPGDVAHRESPPAHAHTENERWQKTLEVQSKTKRKILTSKLQKRRPKGRK